MGSQGENCLVENCLGIALGNTLGFQTQIDELRLKCGILGRDIPSQIMPKKALVF